MFLPSCVEPSRLGLGLQTPADYSQWTRSRSQNTPNRWAEFPGRQRTDNLVVGLGVRRAETWGGQSLKEELKFNRRKGEGLPGSSLSKEG